MEGLLVDVDALTSVLLYHVLSEGDHLSITLCIIQSIYARRFASLMVVPIDIRNDGELEDLLNRRTD